MVKPLDGVRVLDLTNVLAGPFCCYQLGLMGADVIKIELPGRGDLARELGANPARNQAQMGSSFMAQNAGKRSLTLDFKKPGASAIFERLVAGADIVVENFRPGVLARLDFDWPRLQTINPALVYGAISGFGQTGPLAANPAYDQIIQGMSGIMSVTGDQQSAPLRVGFPIADTMGGMTAAFAITAALVQAKSTGCGAFVDVSMLESTLAAMGWAVSNWLLDQIAPLPMGNENITASPSGTFRTASGLLNIAANKQDQFEKLCRLIARIDLIHDPSFTNSEVRKRNRDQLKLELEAGLASDTAENWALVLNQSGVPAGEVLTVPEILANPQTLHRQFLHQLDSGDTVVTGGFVVDGQRPRPAGPPPGLGADTDQVLTEIGYSAQEIDHFRKAQII